LLRVSEEEVVVVANLKVMLRISVQEPESVIHFAQAGRIEMAREHGKEALASCRRGRRWEDAVVVLESLGVHDPTHCRKAAEDFLFDQSAVMAWNSSCHEQPMMTTTGELQVSRY